MTERKFVSSRGGSRGETRVAPLVEAPDRRATHRRQSVSNPLNRWSGPQGQGRHRPRLEVMGRALLLAAALGCTARAAAPAVASAEENPAAPGLSPSSALAKKLAAALAAKGPDFRPNTHHLDIRGRPLFTNRLILETSPYLLQHANNPVSWYAWSDEAFERARREHKPVLLSIGYSTCHWCHVMERESFEDVEVARYMNENYVAIKGDREERPDIDDVYMAAVELLTGGGGWP